jgi:hypothetical protein
MALRRTRRESEIRKKFDVFGGVRRDFSEGTSSTKDWGKQWGHRKVGRPDSHNIRGIT